jgi:hypothetical protein
MALDHTPLFCLIAYFAGTKIWISDLTPIVHYPTQLREAEIDVALAFLDELTLPDDFRRAVPSYVKHHHYCSRNLEMNFTSILKIMFTAVERQRNILLYSRDPTCTTMIAIGFFLRSLRFAPQNLVYNYLESIPKTKENWTQSFLEYVQRMYPYGYVTFEQERQLVGYEQWMVDLDE